VIWADLPALWQAETTTPEERQTIVRLLLERVLVEVVNDTERFVLCAIGTVAIEPCTSSCDPSHA
jgi:hypothetical protein